MSTVRELADAEAARAEAENPDTPPEPTTDEPTLEEEEAEEEAETPPEPTPEPVDIDAQMRAITSELRRHEKAWAKAVGVEPEDLNVCPSCEGVGFTEDAQPPMKEATFTERCEACNGHGEVLSRAVTERSRVIKCLACGGLGYKRTDMGATVPDNGAADVSIAPVEEVDPDVARLREKGYVIYKPPTVSATNV